ncbi:BtpA/SgcQ family protein [Gemmatimonadota bacterium]
MRHEELWEEERPVVGVVHLLPLPGSPRWGRSMDAVLDRAMEDARIMAEGGLHGLLVENYGDTPFSPGSNPPETLAAMAVVIRYLVTAFSIPVGVNILRNDARSALGVAVAAGARFIRVNVHTGSMFTDQGLLEGKAYETLRTRSALGVSVSILADVFVKHGWPPPGATLEGAAQDAWHRGLADGLILTGTRTGSPVDTDEIDLLREALPPEGRIWIGSGASPVNARQLLDDADGLIVGSALQRGGIAGSGVEAPRVRELMDALSE